MWECRQLWIDVWCHHHRDLSVLPLFQTRGVSRTSMNIIQFLLFIKYKDKTLFLSSDIISRCRTAGIKMNAVWITTWVLYETALRSIPVNIDALTDYTVVVYVCLNLIYVLYGLFLCDVIYNYGIINSKVCLHINAHLHIISLLILFFSVFKAASHLKIQIMKELFFLWRKFNK